MRQILKWGDEVVTTKKAIDKNIFPQHRRGICLGNVGGYSLSIVVVCKGQVTSGKYHPSFWRKANKNA